MSKNKTPQTPSKEPQRVKIANIMLGLSVIDPLTGALYTTAPTRVTDPSEWVERQLELGNFVEA